MQLHDAWFNRYRSIICAMVSLEEPIIFFGNENNQSMFHRDLDSPMSVFPWHEMDEPLKHVQSLDHGTYEIRYIWGISQPILAIWLFAKG